MSKTQFPILKWAQRKDKLFVTINVVHAKPPTVDLVEGKKLKYSGTDGANEYAFEIELYDEITKEGSKYTLDSRNIFLNLKKKTAGAYWPRLTKDTVKYQWIQVDWAWYTEEDEEEDASQPNFDGQDFPEAGEMDEDDEVPKDNCECGHDHEGHEHENDKEGEAPKEEKKADLSDLDKEEKK